MSDTGCRHLKIADTGYRRVSGYRIPAAQFQKTRIPDTGYAENGYWINRHKEWVLDQTVFEPRYTIFPCKISFRDPKTAKFPRLRRENRREPGSTLRFYYLKVD